MTPALRKWHRKTWAFMAVGIPVLFTAAVLAIPEKQADPYFNSYQPAAQPELVRSVEAGFIEVQVRGNRITNERQLEIRVKKSLPSAAILVYLSDHTGNPPEGDTFLGTLSSVGNYRFDVGAFFDKHPESFLVLYDPIKKRMVEHLKI